MNDNLIGKMLGRYRIDKKIGQGGMAFVYKAYDTHLERNIAIKVIRRGAFPEEQQKKILQRFHREAISMAKLSHSSIVKVLDNGDFEGSPYLVMDYLPGGTLKDRIGQPIPWRDAVQLLLPIARGLSYAHQLGIIHRDVKPANILFTASGEPVLSDFGIAKLLETEEGQTLTDSGVGIGTPEYMAPEQGKGEKIDARADIYALGIVLYEMVTGKKPFTADTPMKTVIKHITEPLQRPTKYVPSLPLGVESVLIKALAKEPAERYPNMAVFAAALEHLLATSGAAMEETASTIIQAPDDDGDATVDQLGESAQRTYTIPPPPAPKRNFGWVIAVVVAGLGLLGIAAMVFIGNLLLGGDNNPPPSSTEPAYASPTDTLLFQPTSPPNQATYTPYPTLTPYPTDRPPEPTATKKPQRDLTCASVSWSPRVEIGQTVRICTIYRLILRDRPDGNEIIALFWDNYITIIDGPKCGQDAWWWEVEVPKGSKYSVNSTVEYSNFNYTNRVFTGWVKEGLNKELLPDSNGYYLCP